MGIISLVDIERVMLVPIAPSRTAIFSITFVILLVTIYVVDLKPTVASTRWRCRLE